MNYLVTYDVPVQANRIRTKLARVCLRYGLVRLQYSVFWGSLTNAEARELANRCADVAGTIPVDIRVIAVCNRCFEESFAIIKNAYADSNGATALNRDPIYNIATHTGIRHGEGWGWQDPLVSTQPSPIETEATISSSHYPRPRPRTRSEEETHPDDDQEQSGDEIPAEIPDTLEGISFEQMLILTGMTPNGSQNTPDLSSDQHQTPLVTTETMATCEDQEPSESGAQLKGTICSIASWAEKPTIASNNPDLSKPRLSPPIPHEDLHDELPEESEESDDSINENPLESGAPLGRYHRGAKDIDVLFI
jgi:CRISPR-associated endonuclease Cas2